jgi:hypothetical protein
VNEANCLRCGRPCRFGTPDPNARALRHSAMPGLCPNCAVTRFLLDIEPIRETIEGTPARGGIVPALPGNGPQILLLPHVRAMWRPLLAYTQTRPEEIDWETVVSQWDLPWPKMKRKSRHDSSEA